MQLIVDLQASTGQGDRLGDGIVRVLELQSVQGEIDHFDHTPVDQRHAQALEVQVDCQDRSHRFLDRLECVLTTAHGVLSRE